MKNRHITSIDIGSYKVAATVGEVTSGHVRIIGYSEGPSEGIRYGEPWNPLKAARSLEPVLANVREQVESATDEGFRIRDVYANISGQNIRCISASLRIERPDPEAPISQKEIDGMMEEMYRHTTEPGHEVILVVPQYYNVDVHMGETDPVGMDGKTIEGEYRLFTDSSNSVKHSKDVLARLGLNPKALILSPIAAATALLTDDEKELGSVLVDIGAGTTGVLIYKDTIRYAEIIPFGGNAITGDITQTCGISMKNAEQLKLQRGSCISEFAQENRLIIKASNGLTIKEVPSKLLCSAIEARMCEILATVRHIIETSGYQNKLLGRIVITGGSSNLSLLQLLAKNILKMDVRIGIPESGTIIGTSVEQVFKPQASTSVGLILEGMRHEMETPDEEPDYSEEPEHEGTLFTEEETGPKMETNDNIPGKTGKTGNKPGGRNEKKGKRSITSIFTGLFQDNQEDNEA